MNIYVFIGGMLAVVAIFTGGVKVGMTMEKNVTIEANLKQADLVMVKQVEIIKEVPKIVTRVVTRETEVVKEVERVVTVANSLLSPDCVLPDNYGMLLVSAANGVDPAAPGGADEIAGTYGCREVLAATLKDLLAGWRNSERLVGMQEWAKLVTKP